MFYNRIIFCLGLALSFFTITQAQAPIVYIYDASGSMWGQIDGVAKHQIASEVLSDAVHNLPDNQAIGFVVYGHRSKGDCEDIEWLLPMTNTDKTLVSATLKNINPLGKTPLAKSAQMVIDKLIQSKQKATIILITDGIEVCDGDLCEVVKSAKAAGIDFKMHIVGFGLKADEKEALKCAAEAGEGQYLDAEDASQLGQVLNLVNEEKVDDPPKNVRVVATKNGELIDVLVHAESSVIGPEPIATRTYKDTGYMHIPIGTHTLTFKPVSGSPHSKLPPITLANVKIIDEGENIFEVAFDAGRLNFTSTNNGEPWDALVRIYPKGDNKVLVSKRTYGDAKVVDVMPGTYRILFKAMKIEGSGQEIIHQDVQIDANKQVDIDVNFLSGLLKIGAQKGDEMVDATIRVYDIKTNKNIVTKRTYTSAPNIKEVRLSPGIYKIIAKPLGKHKGASQEFQIEIEAGKTLEKVVRF